MGLPVFDDHAGGGKAGGDQMGPVLDFLQLAFDKTDRAGLVRGGGRRRVVVSIRRWRYVVQDGEVVEFRHG